MTISQITGTYGGIVLSSSSFANPVTVTATGKVSSIYATTSWTIDNYGTVTGAGTTQAGIYLNSGKITNAGTGAISGAAYSIYIQQVGTVQNAGTIVGTTFVGVHVGSGYLGNAAGGTISGYNGAGVGYLGSGAYAPKGTVNNSGTIKGTGAAGTGVYLDTGFVTNAAKALITGGQYGVYAEVTGTVFNAGTIIGTAGVGVDLGGGYVSNAAGGTISGAKGVEIYGTTGVVNNFGVIGGNGTQTYSNGANLYTVQIGLGVYLGSGGQVLNASGGAITGSLIAIRVDGASGTVANSGSISGSSDGVYLDQGGSITNNAGGTIAGGQYGVSVYGAAGTVNNSGRIIGTSVDGIALTGGAVSNAVGASISGYGGVLATGSATITNAGTISSTGSTGMGVELTAGGTVSNSGMIAAAGLKAYGVDLKAGGGLGNTGTITGSGNNGGAVLLQAGGTVANSKLISATGTAGIGISGLNGGTVTNEAAGVITASTGVAIATGAGNVNNSGRITGTAGAGISLAGGYVSNAAGGSISSGYSGIVIGASPGTVHNSGTITGVTDSVYFKGAGANRLIVDAGAMFNGTARANAAGTNTLELTSSATAGTLSGIGSHYLGFQTVTIDSGAAWTISGTKTGLTGVTIGAFNAHDTLDVTNLAFAAGESVTLNSATDVLTILDATNHTLDTLQLAGNVTSYFFSVSGDGVSGTDITAGKFVSQISGSHSNGITLTAATYTSSVTVTATGNVSGPSFGIFAATAWTISNQGSIAGPNQGVYLKGGGTVANSAGGSISSSHYGIQMNAVGTVHNSGAISGTTDSIDFKAAGANRLIVDASAAFNGNVVANAAGASSIELTSAASAGTLSGLGTKFTGFKGVTFDANAQWAVAGSFAGINWLSGFHGRDTLDLTSITYSAGDMAVLASGNVLEVVNSASTVLWQVSLGAASYAGLVFTLAPDGSGDTILAVDTPPALTVPGAQTVAGGAKTAITGIKVTDSYAGMYGEMVTVTVSDLSGLLSATAHGAMLSGLNTNQLTVSGSLTEVNSALSSLTYAATKLGGDTVSLHVSASGGTANGMIAVTANPAATSWTFAGLANWGTAADWSGGKVPNDGLTNATIAVAGSKAQISTGQSYAVDTLTVNNATAELILGGNLTSVSGVTVQAGSISLRSGTLTGSLSLASGTSLGGIGTLGGTVSNSGQINDNGGALKISGDVTGTGGLQILKASTLELGGNAAGQTITFGAAGAPQDETLILDHPGDSFGTISGFTTTDTIDLKGVTATTDNYAGGVLTVMNGTTVVATLTIAGNFTNEHFAPASDNNSGTDITLAAGPAPMLARGAPVSPDSDRQTALFAEMVAAHPGASAGFGALSSLGHIEDNLHHGVFAATPRI
jgi:hypothetical protein